ncbi:tetratricopeptide repeat protein [Egbenema bharatensis]|uniref:tetratricopeptide repeat protein n=1 Tax=Egbenema bharatensis TaxID=3463334 RepID=UPI003A8BF59A
MPDLLQLLENLWQFALEHDGIAIAIATPILTCLGWFLTKAGRAFWRTLKKRRTHPPVSSDLFPFEVIQPGTGDVLQRLLDSRQSKADPLADFNVPYQARREAADIRQELENQLNRGWLLLLGRTGLGKTREAAELAKLLNGEGWVVLRLKNDECAWLTEPSRFPIEQIGVSQPKLLFVLDNLGQAMYLGSRSAGAIQPSSDSSDSQEKPLQLADTPLHERLLKTLKFYENACGKDRVRVLATARNEPGELEKLELENHLLWQRFQQYELPDPSNQAIVNLLVDRTTQANIKTNPEELDDIARSNDGTFRNIVENLVKAKNRDVALTGQTFQHSLKGTWKERYDSAIQTAPLAEYIYDAVDLLRQMGIVLHEITVLPTAQQLAGGNFWQRQWRKQKLRTVLQSLIQTERILQPRDGQIEAKGTQIDVKPHIPFLLSLLLNLVDRDPQFMLVSLFSFGVEAIEQQQYQAALSSSEKLLEFTPDSGLVWFLKGIALVNLGQYQQAIDSYDKALEFKPDYHQAWYNRGVTLYNSGQYQQAIDSYDKALEYKPDKHQAWYNRGVALDDLGQYQQAIDSYDKALEYKPDKHQAWNNRGVALKNLGQYQQAIDSYDKALEFKPDDHEAWYSRGGALYKLEQYQQAIDSYDKALEFKPDDHEAWYSRGGALYNSGQYQQAIDSLDKALEYKPDYHQAWSNRGLALANLGQYQQAIDSYDKALEFKADQHEVWYNKACCYGLQGDIEQAIQNLQQSIALNPECRELAKTDEDFDRIRHDDRFQALIEE